MKLRKYILTVLCMIIGTVTAMADFAFSKDGYDFRAYAHAGAYKNSAGIYGISEEALEKVQNSDGVLTFPNTVEYEGTTYTAWKIGGQEFWCNHRYNEGFQKAGIKEIIIPDSICGIDGNIFLDLPDLKKLTIGKSLQTIGYGNFYDIQSIRTIRFIERDENVGLTLLLDAFKTHLCWRTCM